MPKVARPGFPAKRLQAWAVWRTRRLTMAGPLVPVARLGQNSLMRYVSASEARRRWAAVLDGVRREPVTVLRRNREVAVMLSPVDYRRLTGDNVAEFQRFCDRVSEGARARGITAEVLDEVLGPEP